MAIRFNKNINADQLEMLYITTTIYTTLLHRS